MNLLRIESYRAFSTKDDCDFCCISASFNDEQHNVTLKEPITREELSKALISLSESIERGLNEH